jgi:futalosine hydrolase
MHLLLVAATPFEILPLTEWLRAEWDEPETGLFTQRNHPNGHTVQVLVTGVGTTATAWHLATTLAQRRPDLAMNAGIAGSLERSWPLGSVVNVLSDRFADLGVEEADGQFQDLFDLGLADRDKPPFTGGRLWNESAAQAAFLPTAHGVTVQKVHGFEPSIEALRRQYPDAQIESMEGAAFFYGCLQAGVPMLQIRSISNYVEKRNRAAWAIGPAIDALNGVLKEMLEALLK